MNTIETLDPTPFKHLVMSIGALPTSFVDGMSYYECMAWLVAYIRDNVVPACNNNAEAIEEIQQWIETLDLQDEVDHKLDEMAENGQLAEIISQYLNSIAIFGYDTVADMQSADNLIAGSYARTLGYHSINDGGGALYSIVDTAPASGHYETVGDSLYAALQYEGVILPTQYGAYHDGTHDDSDALQACFDELHQHTYKVMDLQGYKYWIGKPLRLDSTFRATIKNGEINALDTFQTDPEDTYKNYLIYTTNVNNNPEGEVYGTVATEDIKINNLTLDCKYVTGVGCLNLRYYLRANIDNCIFRRYLTEGIKTSNDSSHELILTNSTFNASLGSGESNATGIGIVCNGYDNVYSNIIITGGLYGISMNSAKANLFSKVHIYGQSTYSIYLYNASQNTFDQLYIDGKGIYIYNPWLVTFENCYFLVNMSPITLDKTGTASSLGLKFVGCVGTNYSDNSVNLLTFPNGRFSHFTECEFDITTTEITDNRYLVEPQYTSKFNKCFINQSTGFGLNPGCQIIQLESDKYTFTGVNNIVDVTAYNSSGDGWLGFVVPLENNKTYKCINKVNNTANFRIIGLADTNLWTPGTKIKEATPSQYGYDTFSSGTYNAYIVAVYGQKRWDIEITEV